MASLSSFFNHLNVPKHRVIQFLLYGSPARGCFFRFFPLNPFEVAPDRIVRAKRRPPPDETICGPLDWGLDYIEEEHNDRHCGIYDRERQSQKSPVQITPHNEIYSRQEQVKSHE